MLPNTYWPPPPILKENKAAATIFLSPYHTGQLFRQFVRLFCWPTDLEHPHARRPVVIEALYPIITTTEPLLPKLAQHICGVVPKVLILILDWIIKKISYERLDYE